MKIYILKPCFSKEHFKSNIFVTSSGNIDILCFIHAITFNIVFFERKGLKHLEANKTHLKITKEEKPESKSVKGHFKSQVSVRSRWSSYYGQS